MIQASSRSSRLAHIRGDQRHRRIRRKTDCDRAARIERRILGLAEAVVYLCLAPKSNSVYTAYAAVQEEIERTRQEPVPLHLRNAPTRLMKEIGYARGYRYAHDEQDRIADMDCLPDSLKGRTYYHPTQEGREKLLAQRMEEIRRIRSGKRNQG